MIADALRKAGKVVHEEVPCTAFVASDKRIDMIVIDPSIPKTGWVLDPTVRWERNTKAGGTATEEEKYHMISGLTNKRGSTMNLVFQI